MYSEWPLPPSSKGWEEEEGPMDDIKKWSGKKKNQERICPGVGKKLNLTRLCFTKP